MIRKCIILVCTMLIIMSVYYYYHDIQYSEYRKDLRNIECLNQSRETHPAIVAGSHTEDAEAGSEAGLVDCSKCLDSGRLDLG